MSREIISTNFTIDDIHNIREENYDRTVNMTLDEKIAYYNNLGKKAEEEIEKRRALILV